MAVRKKRAKKAARKTAEAPPAPSQRARARDLGPAEILPRPRDKADRVTWIAQLMVDDLWRTGRTAQAIAKVWGLSASTVEDYSAEASRQLRSGQDLEDMRLRFRLRLEAIADEALDLGELRTASDAVFKAASLAGVVSQKLEHSGPDGAPLKTAVMIPLEDPEPDGAPPEEDGDAG